MRRGVSGTLRLVRPRGSEGIKKKALEVLGNADLASVYDAAQLNNKDNSIDTAVKVVLAEKLVDSINMAKRYAKKANMKRINAAAVLIAAQENRW